MFRRMTLAGAVLGFIAVGGMALRSAPDEPEDPSALAEARMKIARQFYEIANDPRSQPAGGTPDYEAIVLWSGRWMDAQLDMSDQRTDRIAAIRAHIERLKKWELPLEHLANRAVTSRRDVDLIKFHRLEAEFRLAKAEGR